MSGLAGQEDPFFKNMKVLYGKKGFRGFIEENAALLNKAIPPEDIKWASKRYKKVAGPIMRSPILNKIPISNNINIITTKYIAILFKKISKKAFVL